MAKITNAYELFTAAHKGANSMTVKGADKLVTSVISKGTGFYNAIQAAAVAAISLSLPHDLGGHADTSRAIKLLAALGDNREDQRALVAYFATSSNIRAVFNAKEKVWKAKMAKTADADYVAGGVLGSIAVLLTQDFRDYKPAKGKADVGRSDLDFAKAIEKLVKRFYHDDAALSAGAQLQLMELEALGAKAKSLPLVKAAAKA